MAITDNLQEKIRQAKAAGYTDAQIQTYLSSQGVTMQKGATQPFSTPLTRIAQGRSSENVEVAKGAIKQAARDISSAGAQNAGPVGAKIVQDARNKGNAFVGALDAFQTRTQPNSELQREGARSTLIAEAALPGPRVAAVGAKAAQRTAAAGARVATDITKAAAAKAGDMLTPIEKGVQNVLEGERSSRISEKFTRYVTQAENAIADYSIATPLELAGQEGERALKALQLAKNTIGQRKSAVTESLANADISNLPSVARRQLRTAVRELSGTVLKANQTVRNAAGRLSTVSDPADMKLLREVDGLLAKLEAKPSFQRADDAIDHIQDLLFKRAGNTAVPVNSKVEAALKNVVRDLNDGLKRTADKTGNLDYSNLNAAYREYADLFSKLNKGLGLEGNKGAALMKQLFSPNGTLPRKLFASIKDKTGIDLVEEATLAKFAMENIGDVRQASLLEQVLKGNAPTNGRGLIQLAGEWALQKVQNPIGKARRIIRRSSK